MHTRADDLELIADEIDSVPGPAEDQSGTDHTDGAGAVLHAADVVEGDGVASRDVIWKRLRRRWTAFPPGKRPRQARPLAPLWSCAHPRYRSRPRTPSVKIMDCGLFLYRFP